MKQMIWTQKVNLANPQEPVREWLEANKERNGFDPEMLKYPKMDVYSARCNGKVLGYLPVQAALILESFGPNPHANVHETTAGYIELVKGAALIASQFDMKEIYFIGSDENTNRAAIEHMGFSEIGYPVLRRKL